MKQLIIKILLILVIYLLLIFSISAIFPNFSELTGRIISGVIVVISWALATLIMKKVTLLNNGN